MQPLLTQLLALPGIEVEDYRNLDNQLILEVEAISEASICPRCGQESRHLHQNNWYLARDLSISEQQVLLKVNRRQFKCNTCAKPFSEELNFIGNRRKYKDRFASMITQQVVHSDTHNVAVNNDLTDDEVWSMVQAVSLLEGCAMSVKKMVIELSGLSRRSPFTSVGSQSGRSKGALGAVDDPE